MKWKNRHLDVNTPIPHLPPRQHHWDPNIGDRLTAWRTVPPDEAFDGNLTPVGKEIFFMHTGTPGGDGYPWVVDAVSGRTRPMNTRELHTPAGGWGVTGVKRWRDRHGQAPMTLLEGLAWCTANHRLCAMEPKGPAWAASDQHFALLYAVCRETGHPAWVKRLATLRFPKRIVMSAHRAHVQIAAIYGPGVPGRARRLAMTARLTRRWRKVRFDATW